MLWTLLLALVLGGDTTAPVPAIVEGAVWRDPAAGDFTAREYTGRPTLPGLVSIVPGIALSKAAGVAPCVVMASASPTTAVGCEPYTELCYWWSCDAPAEWMIDPAGTRAVDASKDQSGPEAAFLFRRAGTYTITLTARGWTGSRWIVSRATAMVTVNQWQGETREFDPATSTPADLAAWVGRFATNRRALLKSGSSWPVVLQWRGVTGCRLGTYGGAEPARLDGLELLTGYGWDNTGNVVEGVQLPGVLTYESGNGNQAQPYGRGGDLLWLDCRFTGMGNTQLPRFGGVAWWGCRFEHPGAGHGLIWNASAWMAVVGCRFEGGNGHVILDHHIYPRTREHSLIRWVDTGPCQSLNFAINMDAPMDRDSLYTLISDCRLAGTQNGHDWSNAGNSPTAGCFDLTVSQRNLILPSPAVGYQGIGVYARSLKRFALRDTKIGGARLGAVELWCGQGGVYRCQVYQPGSRPPVSVPAGVAVEGVEVGR